MENEKYCIYIDVLGYCSLVEDTNKSQAQIIEKLNSIYVNLAVTIGNDIITFNNTTNSKIFIKSFSDCFYLECTDILSLLYTCKEIYNDIFNLYSRNPIGNDYTPLVRSGIVKDWTVNFQDLAGYINSQNIMNPVGLGVARAYKTSEKSSLSGMRMIISPEVMDDISYEIVNINGLNCYKTTFSHYDIIQELFFYKIQTNEKEENIDLYELIWPNMNSCTFDYIDHLVNIRNQFTLEAFKHYNKTAEIILKGLKVSDCQDITPEHFNIRKIQLEQMAIERFV